MAVRFAHSIRLNVIVHVTHYNDATNVSPDVLGTYIWIRFLARSVSIDDAHVFLPLATIFISSLLKQKELND